MRVAITGATGFIGKHLVEKHLSNGDEIHVLSRKKNTDFPKLVNVFNGDLLDDEYVLAPFFEGVDVFYHCAAEIKEEDKMYKVNVEGTSNLIRAAKGNIKHWVQLSSTGVYGPITKGVVTEIQILNPVNTYERSKVDSDKLVIKAGEDKLFAYSIVRPSNVFGPDMRNQSLFQLIKMVDKGMFFFIGSEGANANYIPVENLVQALFLVGTDDRAKGRIFNISDVMTMEQFIGIIARNLNKPLPKLRIPLLLMKLVGALGDMIPNSPIKSSRVSALTNRAEYQNNLIENDLDYRPVISMEQGVENLAKAYVGDNTSK